VKQFQRGAVPPEQVKQVRDALAQKYPPEMVDSIMGNMDESEIWLNDEYQVTVYRFFNQAIETDMIHLSIKRIDKEPIRSWADMQEIKNQLIGRNREAFELFPAESRLVDTSNQYHLWAAADPSVRFPVGFETRLTSWEDDLPDLPVKQRERKGKKISREPFAVINMVGDILFKKITDRDTIRAVISLLEEHVPDPD
jgi:hypothetical protein